MAWNDENKAPSVTGEVDAALVSLGQRGCACSFDGSGVPAGNYAAIQLLSDVVFTKLDTVEGADASSPFFPLVDNGFTVPSGTILYGPFTAIESFAGTYIAYKA